MTRKSEQIRPIALNEPIGDETKTTTCYMCACRCGIKVHLKDGELRYIEGNRDHPVNRGVICGKGAAGIMHQHAPAKLTQPLRRVGPRGSGQFEPISWDDALTTVSTWLAEIRRTDPRKLAFFTGRDQSQSLTGWWAQQFGTPNFAAHGGFCSVNMAAAGLYTIGGSFWEFGEPDWPRARYLLMFGIAEDHDSNPIKIGLSEMKRNGAKIVSVNPVRTGYSAIADEWIGITPGSDGLFIQALIHELLRAGHVDVDYLLRFTNAAWLVIDNPGASDHGLFARADDGRPLVWNRKTGTAAAHADAAPSAAMQGAVTLDDGRKARPAFALIAERYLAQEHAPEAVADRTGIAAETTRRIARELAAAAFDSDLVVDQPWTDWHGQRHASMVGRPVAMHAMRGISAHTNGFHTCRALHMLQVLLGTIDSPGGFRYKPPFPRPAPPGPQPAGKPGHIEADTPLPGMPLGFPRGPEDLLVDENGAPTRIDKAFSWEAPLGLHGQMHRAIPNAGNADPYPIDTLFMYMANMAWNSSMNIAGTVAHLTAIDPETGDYAIPHIVYSDAFNSETVAYADIVLPDTTYLERWDCISLLDRPISDADGPADSIRQPLLSPDRDVRPFQSVLLDLGARLALPGMALPDGSPAYPGGYPDYMVNHQRKPGIGPLAGWRGTDGDSNGHGAPNPDQLSRYVANGCFWKDNLASEQRFFKHGNQAYLAYAARMGFVAAPDPVTIQLYSEPLQKFRLAAQGHGPIQPPDGDRQRIARYCDPLPFWYPPFEDSADTANAFPLHAVTQRPMAMYHSWGSQNAWLRQIHTRNRLYIPVAVAKASGLDDDDWAVVRSRHGKIQAQVRVMNGVNDHTVWTWNAIAKKAGAWGLSSNAPESKQSFLFNDLIDDLLPEREDGYRYAASDPVTGQAAWYDLRVTIEKIDPPAATHAPPSRSSMQTALRYGARFNDRVQSRVRWPRFGAKRRLRQ